MGQPCGPVTELLARWREGDQESLNRLIPLVANELRAIARRHLTRERPDHTLQATALVNETYLRLVGESGLNLEGRAHFLAVAARLMRQILVDYARERKRAKRGGGCQVIALDEALLFAPSRPDELVALDDALQALARLDPRKVEIVELRYFGGLCVEETAAALGVHPNTVIRDWKLARAWLKRELSSEDHHAG